MTLKNARVSQRRHFANNNYIKIQIKITGTTAYRRDGDQIDKNSISDV